MAAASASGLHTFTCSPATYNKIKHGSHSTEPKSHKRQQNNAGKTTGAEDKRQWNQAGNVLTGYSSSWKEFAGASAEFLEISAGSGSAFDWLWASPSLRLPTPSDLPTKSCHVALFA